MASLLPKKGHSFLSISTHDVDAIHNLTYKSHYKVHFHMDFSLARLKVIQSDLPQNTILILGEMNHLPFKNDSIDGLISFDYLNNYEKEIQNQSYLELKRCLKADGVSIMLYDKDKPLDTKSQLKSDQLVKKALSIVAPWKKVKLPNIIFYPIDESKVSNGKFVANPSFG
jgi:ubiquinone/menaquinone biosynthesis C-methylase UbiE